MRKPSVSRSVPVHLRKPLPWHGRTIFVLNSAEFTSGILRVGIQPRHVSMGCSQDSSPVKHELVSVRHGLMGIRTVQVAVGKNTWKLGCDSRSNSDPPLMLKRLQAFKQNEPPKST
eukprot:725329-Hanusia_phi.AAC.2